MTEREQRSEFLNTLLTTPHRDLAALQAYHEQMIAQDPLFYVHLAAWYADEGQVRDHKEMLRSCSVCRTLKVTGTWAWPCCAACHLRGGPGGRLHQGSHHHPAPADRPTTTHSTTTSSGWWSLARDPEATEATSATAAATAIQEPEYEVKTRRTGLARNIPVRCVRRSSVTCANGKLTMPGSTGQC